MDYNKAKVEKRAKNLEPGISDGLKTDNRSVLRAVSRFQASKELYPESTPEQIAEAMFEAFYKDAKWQPAWEDPFRASSAAFLGDYLKTRLAAPAVRGRRKAEAPVPAPLPATVDPEATLSPERGAQSAAV